MAALFYNILFAGIAATFGMAAGWWIRGGGIRGASTMKRRHSRYVPQRLDPYPDGVRGCASEHLPEPEPNMEPEPELNLETESGPDQELLETLNAAEALISRLHEFTESMAADVGEHNTRVEEINKELTTAGDAVSVILIVEKLVDANAKMQSRLNAAENQLQTQAIEIESHVREARTDALTKLLNRRAFDDELEAAWQDLDENDKPCSIMLIDIDHFKRFNDTYGHQAGDEVLRGASRVLQKNTMGRGVVFRYGGEEYAIIFSGMHINDAMPHAERARAAIAGEPFSFEGLELKVTASAGLGELRKGEQVKRLIKRTDAALYVSKEEGRNCGHWHDGDTSHPIKVKKPQTKPAPGQDAVSFKLIDDDPLANQRYWISGISDKQTFLEDVERRLAERRRGGSTLSLLLVEINSFGSIADEFGAKAGELVIRAAAQFLKATMRDMDHIARHRDHAFAMMLPGAGITETTSIAERLRGAVEKCKLPINGEHVGFTVSIGAAEALEDAECEAFFRRATRSLDAANEAGGNVCFAITKDGDCREMSFV